MLVHNGRVCLIRRQREAGLRHSLPGGLVEDENGEEPADALRVRQLTADDRSFGERLKAAGSNLRFQDRRVADLEAQIAAPSG